jgi:hypothetical protein
MRLELATLAVSVIDILIAVLPSAEEKVDDRFERGTAIILIPLSIAFDSLVKVYL